MESSEKVLVDSESISSPLLQQIDNVIIQDLEYPWKDVEDTKPTDLEYELFCGALESFLSKPLVELIDDWTISMETILPTIRSSIRIYTKAASCEEKVHEMDKELARWVEFGLSSSHSTLYVGNSQMVMIGCSLTKQLSAMHEKDLSVTFCAPKYLQYITDIMSSKQYCSSVRCEAAQALLNILFHPLVSWKFMMTEFQGNKYTPYEQIIHLFIKPEDAPIDLLVVLQKITSYFALKYNIDIIINNAQTFFIEDCDIDVDTPRLFSSFKFLNSFFLKIRNDFSCMSRNAHRAIVKNRVIPHICAHALSPNQDARIRVLAIRCLRSLCDFDGTDITGAIFLSHMDKQTISLVGRLLQQISEDSKEKSLLPYALRAIVLVDQLAAANEKCVLVIDSPERIIVLQNMLHMLLVEEGCLSMISALSFGDNLKHLLHMCDLQKSALMREGHIDDDIKTRFRQTATYGYFCEILFALARNQSSGKFWRIYGPEIIKLIDCNLISAATSLKQWLEPFREELAVGKNINTLNYLTMRLTYHSEKYVEGDPPLALVTLLRLIDSILDEPENETLFDVSSDEVHFDYYARFYEDDGLEKITRILDVANAQQNERVRYRCTSLSGDSYIYCQFVRSAASIIFKLLSSLQAVNQNPDKLIIDTLLRTYTLCCMDEASSDHIIREIIIKSFALFIFPILANRQGLRKTSQQSFLELFLDSGFEKPQNFFATLDVILRLFPLPSDLLTNTIGIDAQEVNSMEKLWSSYILENGKQLQFAIMLVISSSLRIKRRLFDLFKRLSYCSKSNSLRLADILIRQSLRILTSSAYTAIVDAFDDDLMEEEESDVRFGNAVDVITASFFSFLAICSEEFVLRNSMIIIISQRKNYVPTLLKFFKLASPKTLPHVSFQMYIIKIFRNLCIADNNVDGEIDCLPRDIYIKICDSLVEHFGNVQHNIETAMQALESVCSIGLFSAFGRAVVSNALISSESALLHFMDRILMGEAVDQLLFDVAARLIDLFENILKKDSVKLVLKSFTDSEQHPLVRLKNRLIELNCSKDMLLSLQTALDALNQEEKESVEAVKLEDLEAYEWPENVTTVQQVDSQQRNYHVKDLLNFNNRNFPTSATLSTVDLNMLNDEFFPESALLSLKKSVSPIQLQSGKSIQKWKTFNFESSKRKRPFATKKSVVRPKLHLH